MSSKACEFRVSKDDFLRLPQGEQSSLIYNCMMDMQEKIDWKWKRVLGMGALAGFAGGFFNHMIRTIGWIKF